MNQNAFPGIIPHNLALASRSITSERFLHWCDDIHILDVLAGEEPPTVDLRYENTNPSAE
jgi:hypothetical protein